MKIVADYKKRKELKEYLPHDEHWKLKSDRKSVEKVPAAAATTVTASLSPNSAAALLAEGTEAKLTTQTSEERKRSLSMMDTEAATPPPKKLNTENGDTEVIEEAESEVLESVVENNGDEAAAVN